MIHSFSAGNIVVETFTGKTLDLYWERSDTVYYLKAMIEEREGIPTATQRFIFAGKQLEDSRTRSGEPIADRSSHKV
jgi:hypothetical protein